VIFFTEDDYHYYGAALQQAKSTCQCQIYAYVLMTNHVHLLVEPSQAEDLGHFMQGQSGSDWDSASFMLH
jgi:putative transposase